MEFKILAHCLTQSPSKQFQANSKSNLILIESSGLQNISSMQRPDTADNHLVAVILKASLNKTLSDVNSKWWYQQAKQTPKKKTKNHKPTILLVSCTYSCNTRDDIFVSRGACHRDLRQKLFFYLDLQNLPASITPNASTCFTPEVQNKGTLAFK